MLKTVIEILLIFFIVRFIYLFWKYFHPKYEQKIRLIIGDTGLGKTSKAVADAIAFNKYMDKIIRKQLGPIYLKLKNNGFPQIEMPDTFVYGDVDMALKGTLENPILKQNDFKFEDLGSLVPDNNLEDLKIDASRMLGWQRRKIDKRRSKTAKLSIGAYGVFDEVANKIDSRESSQLSNGFSALLRLHRKAYYNLTFMYPQFGDADKRIRENCHEIQLIIGMIVFKIPFTEKVFACKWDYISYTGPARVANCESNKRPFKFTSFFRKLFGFKADTEWRSKWFFGDIFKHYESRSEIAYFLKGLNRYENRKSRKFEYSRDFINYYCKLHPAFMPDSKKKKAMREKEKLMRIQKKEVKEKNERNRCENKKTVNAK